MARMRVVSLNRWGDGGIQVSFEMVSPVPEAATNHTEMAMPENKSEFSRLMAIKLYDEYDIDGKKVIASAASTT